MEEHHKPVLLSEVLRALNPQPGESYLDLTAGYAGHASRILDVTRNYKDSVLVDRDDYAINVLKSKYESEEIKIMHMDFYSAALQLYECGNTFDMVLADFGVSSPQLDQGDRGFSFSKEGTLDMRMDRMQKLSAYEVVNEWSFEELRRIISEYGEERYASKVASAIVRSRDKKEISGTLELVEIIKAALPGAALREKQHPAKRTFQGIRIAVNDELGEIERFLATLPDVLKSKGRAVIITFHSLEDRLVKHAFRIAEKPCTCPPSLPVCVCGKKPTLKVITNKPVLPGKDELDKNPRSRSAKVRVAEKI